MNDKGGDNQSLAKTLEMCGDNPDLTVYTSEAYADIERRYGKQENSDVVWQTIDEAHTMATFIENKTLAIKSKLHDGSATDAEVEMLRPGYFNNQDSTINKAIERLDDTSRYQLTDMSMYFSIDNNSKFMRGYKSHGVPLPPPSSPGPNEKPSSSNVADYFFDSWLVSNQLTCKGGYIYKTDQADAQGKYAKAEPGMVSQLLNDPLRGLASVIKKHERQDLNISITVQESGKKKQPAPTPGIPQPEIQAEVSKTEPDVMTPEAEGPSSSAGAGG